MTDSMVGWSDVCEWVTDIETIRSDDQYCDHAFEFA